MSRTLATLVLLLSPVAWAASPGSFADEALECADRVEDAALLCDAPEEGIASCACAVAASGGPEAAYFVRTDADTVTPSEGRLLVARDFTDEQGTASVHLWVGSAVTSKESSALARALDAVLKDAALDELSAEQATVEAAHELGHIFGASHDTDRSGDVLTHEVGHWLGLMR